MGGSSTTWREPVAPTQGGSSTTFNQNHKTDKNKAGMFRQIDTLHGKKRFFNRYICKEWAISAQKLPIPP